MERHVVFLEEEVVRKDKLIDKLIDTSYLRMMNSNELSDIKNNNKGSLNSFHSHTNQKDSHQTNFVHNENCDKYEFPKKVARRADSNNEHNSIFHQNNFDSLNNDNRNNDNNDSNYKSQVETQQRDVNVTHRKKKRGGKKTNNRKYIAIIGDSIIK